VGRRYHERYRLIGTGQTSEAEKSTKKERKREFLQDGKSKTIFYKTVDVFADNDGRDLLGSELKN